MSFGKRGAGNGGSDEGSSDYREPVSVGPKLTVASSGGLDLKFVMLAVGVVILSAGGAMAAPSLLSMLSPHHARSIEQIAALGDREQIKAALATDAFPDRQGQAFMASLHKHYPDEHDRLLGRMADMTSKGSGRDQLALVTNLWLADFVPQALPALGRTGAQGFDATLDIVHEGLVYVENAAGGCDMNALQTLVSNPNKLIESTAYGSRGYQFNMKASRQLVELAAAGRDLPELDRKLKPEDEQAVQAVVLSIMSDPQFVRMMQMSMAGESSQQQMMAKLDICKIGRNVIQAMKSLPSDTKSRLWATGAYEAGQLLRRGPPNTWLSQGRPQDFAKFGL